MAFTPGFNAAEATTMLALCAIMNNNTTYTRTPAPAPAPPPGPDYPNWPGIPNNEVVIPAGWYVQYSPTGPSGLDNFWQLWANNNVSGQFALVFQGTEDPLKSITEDLLAVMIPATGSITVNGTANSYQLAANPDACVHAGFAYGLSSMLEKIMEQINLAKLFHESNLEIFITGHSMGAALATLCRSFFAYYTGTGSISDVPFKTYLFAQPMPGNDAYGLDFELLNSQNNMAIRIVNSQDWVPQAPLTLQQISDLNTPNPVTVYEAKYPIIKTILDGVAAAEGELTKFLQDALENAIKTESGDTVSFTIAPTLNYRSCGTQNIVLQGTPAQGATETGDFMWQHHATMYYALLTSQYPVS